MTREEQAAAVRADPDGFAATLRPLCRTVARKAPSRLRDDVAAACWLAVLVAARKFDPARGVAPIAWCSRAAETARVDCLRKLGRAGLTGGDGGRPLPVGVERMGDRQRADGSADPAAAIDAADWWAVAARRLTPTHRRALWLRLIEGREFTETAAALGCSRSKAWRLVDEAIELLRGDAR